MASEERIVRTCASIAATKTLVAGFNASWRLFGSRERVALAYQGISIKTHRILAKHTVALGPKDVAIWNEAIGELNIMRLCAADRREPSGEL
jgi:hypothetical protein